MMNEVFKNYVEGINKQTEALQFGFQKMVEGGFVDISNEATHAVIERPAPVIDKKSNVTRPKKSKMHLSAKLIKDASTYSNPADMKASKFTPGFGLDRAKELTVAGGMFEIEVKQDASFKYIFTIFKDGERIGVVHPSRDNKDLISRLEMYPGQTVVVNARLKRECPLSIFTSLEVEIVGIEQQLSEPQAPKQPEVINSIELEDGEPDSDLDFGELDMGSLSLFGGLK